MFTIAIPAFKAKYLKECIESVLLQSYTDFELIIINDSSPDEIDTIVNSYDDNRIQYFINKTNIGAYNVIDNWNKCLLKANREYFILLGDDDVLNVNYLSEFDRLIKKYPALNIYHCRSKIISEDSIPFDLTTINPEFESIYDYIYACLKNHRTQYISDFVYRTETLKNDGGFYKLPLAWGSDFISAFIATGQKGIAHTNELVFNYRLNRINISSTGDLLIKRKAYIGYQDWIYDFLSYIPNNKEDILKHDLIRQTLKQNIIDSKVGFVRQVIGNKSFKLLLRTYKQRKSLRISARDFTAAALLIFADSLKAKTID